MDLTNSLAAEVLTAAGCRPARARAAAQGQDRCPVESRVINGIDPKCWRAPRERITIYLYNLSWYNKHYRKFTRGERPTRERARSY